MEKVGYNISVQVYTASQFVDIDINCNGFTVTNLGDTIVSANDMILYPGTPGSLLGDSRTVGGNLGEIYKGKLRIVFQAPVNANPKIEVIQKFYVK